MAGVLAGRGGAAVVVLEVLAVAVMAEVMVVTVVTMPVVTIAVEAGPEGGIWGFIPPQLKIIKNVNGKKRLSLKFFQEIRMETRDF